MAKDIESEQSLLDFGGVYVSTSNVFAHDNLLDVGDVSEGKFNTISDFSHVDDSVAIHFDVSCDEEKNSESCQPDYFFS